MKIGAIGADLVRILLTLGIGVHILGWKERWKGMKRTIFVAIQTGLMFSMGILGGVVVGTVHNPIAIGMGIFMLIVCPIAAEAIMLINSEVEKEE